MYIIKAIEGGYFKPALVYVTSSATAWEMENQFH